MQECCDFRQLLISGGLRCTSVRLEILEILRSSPRPLQVKEIIEAIRAHRRVNKVTVYRALEELNGRKIIRRLLLESRACYFELACEHRPRHPHFFCHSCGEIQCLDPAPVTRMWTELQGPIGNRVNKIDIRVEGICHKCWEPK